MKAAGTIAKTGTITQMTAMTSAAKTAIAARAAVPPRLWAPAITSLTTAQAKPAASAPIRAPMITEPSLTEVPR